MTAQSAGAVRHMAPREARAGWAGQLWRLPLAAKLAFAFIGLVALVLLVNGAVEAWLGYNQAKRAALEVQAEKARAAADRVGEFLAEIQTVLGWTTGAEWKRTPLDQQRYDFIRLLRQAPAITALSYIDGQGKEQLAVSRLEPDSIASGKDFSGDPRFVRAVADKIWFGPVEFRRGSEPYMTIALAHVGKNPGVTVADVNLKLIWDVISAIHVGEKGYAYVVDDKGRLIADPDLSLVLRDTDLSALPQVKKALVELGAGQAPAAGAAAPGGAQPLVGSAEIAKSLGGGDVLTAYAIAPKPRWIVFVQQPLAEALASVTQSLLRTLALLGLGLALAIVSGVALARRMAAPIRLLQTGAERLGAGDLAQRIDVRTGDEIEILADRFNQMAERIKESYETLEAKVEARTRDLNEALEQQTATAEVLKVISRSAFDLRTVLDTLTQSAATLCNTNYGLIFLREGEYFHARASFPRDDERLRASDANPRAPGRGSMASRVALSGKVEQIPDISKDAEYNLAPQYWFFGSARALLGLPLLREGRVEGIFVLGRLEPGLFSERQVEIVQTFADQAVIAIENARLFEEVQAKTRDLEEALAQQTATADVLKVISRSAFDLDAVLKTLTDSARSLSGAATAMVFLRDGEVLRIRAESGCEPEFVEYASAHPIRAGRETVAGRVVTTGEAVHIPDVLADADYDYGAGPRLGNYRAALGAPLIRDGRVDGVFTLNRPEPGAFTSRQIELVRTFADQAVIAIENARLLNEVQAKTRDLEESLAQQTATADVLKVISRSAFDLQVVFRVLVENAVRLCGAQTGMIFQRDGDLMRLAAADGPTQAFTDYVRDNPIPGTRQAATGRALLEGRTVQILDVEADPDYAYGGQSLERYRTIVAVPLVRNETPIGVFTLWRHYVEAFTPRQLALVETFADQAVVAIENARLFEEVQAKTRDLEEALAQQTATADVLKVISRSAFDLQAVLDTLIKTAVDLNDAYTGSICVREGDVFRYRAFAGKERHTPLEAHLRLNPAVPGRDSVAGRTILNGRIEHVPDVREDADFHVPLQALGNPSRSLIGVPLIGKEGVEGAIVLARLEPGPYPPRQVEILKTFADQAVIAIENARLFDEVQARTQELAHSLDDLHKAQDRLIQSEKLASLGQLTAGIAHEIKNPLNFVNNYSSLSRELLGELKETLAAAPLAAAARNEVDELVGMVDSNLDKVTQHGRRADAIVKNMLLHSREGSGERTAVDVNALVEEALNLGYHGARAEKPGFNVTIEKTLDPAAGSAELYHQEMTRVLLNLISNGFYATSKRKQIDGASYEPTLTASTRNLGDRVEIRIRDNGTGIPDDVKAKMFDPFFTTKPAGEGTGLGLSLSHDIVVKQHGGAIEVATEPGRFTEFIIALPRGLAPGPRAIGAAA